LAPQEATGNWGKVEGVDILGGHGIHAFKLHGVKERVRLGHVKVEGQPFDLALRAEIKEQSPNNWDVQVQARNAVPVARGDVLLATFYFRSETSRQESGEGETEFVFELARSPYSKSVAQYVRGGREWKKVYVPFVSKQDFAVGEAQAILRLGYAPEVFHVGGFTLNNFGKKLALADLPTNKMTYPGMEPDAPWRQEAAERIERLRKAELQVVVKDKSGRPVPGAKVRATLSKHSFMFGTCAPAARIVDPSQTKYQSIMTELFNSVTLENDLKWVALAGDWGASFTMNRTLAAVDWLHKHSMPVRGHVLVWPGWRNLPKYLRAYQKNPEQLRAEIRKHIQEVAGQVKGRVIHWDVVNEPFDNHDALDILGSEVMVDWFKLAHAADPKPKLFINDYAILSGGGGPTAHRDHYEKTIQMLIDQGAPLDGIGMQGHFGEALTPIPDLLSILDRFEKLGKPIFVTEYDIVLADEEVAGNYTRDFYTALFSHAAVGGIVMWGFWDESHWKGNAPLYRRDWSLKPAGQAYRDLILKTWRTNESGTTDANGVFATRGFLGTYALEVARGAHRTRATGTLKQDGAPLTVTLD
jgi:GH35 family endo-1,4-beta-xylanase